MVKLPVTMKRSSIIGEKRVEGGEESSVVEGAVAQRREGAQLAERPSYFYTGFRALGLKKRPEDGA